MGDFNKQIYWVKPKTYSSEEELLYKSRFFFYDHHAASFIDDDHDLVICKVAQKVSDSTFLKDGERCFISKENL